MRINNILILLFVLQGHPLWGQLKYYATPLKIPVSLSGNFGELRPNHFHTAGDFRTEGGSRPVLTLRSGEVHCRTFHSKAVNEGYPELSWDTPADVGTHPYAIQGCCDYNCVLWSELVEEIDTYEI